MRRAAGHRAFAAAAAAFAALALGAASRVHRADVVNAAIAATTASAVDEAMPESRLAQAQALAAAGAYDAALAGYQGIERGSRRDLRHIALYDAGNLNLRRALAEDPQNLTAILPLVEIAKRRYRDLLREDPGQWDARYNLESALKVVPDNDAADDADLPPPEHSDHAPSTDNNALMELP